MSNVKGTELLRSELFSIEQLKRHAVKLAGQHRLDPDPGPDKLLPRLSDNEKVLLSAYQVVTTAVVPGQRVIAAEAWLLDNFYLNVPMRLFDIIIYRVCLVDPEILFYIPLIL